jgi:hypothetical protein
MGKAATKISARQAAITVLERNGNKPIKLGDLAAEAFKLAKHLKGKNPAHTIKIRVIQGHLHRHVFERTSGGHYRLRKNYRDQLAAPKAKPTRKAATTKPARKAAAKPKTTAKAAPKRARRRSITQDTKAKVA